MKKPEEKSEDKKTPKRLYIKIPKGYYNASTAEQDAFIDALIITPLMNQFQESKNEKGEE